MQSADLWIKTLHIVAVISWMAGMLYLPRLFVYHAGAMAGSEVSETLKIMERRLLKAIVTPAMLLAWASGLTLAYREGYLLSPWLHAKLVYVVALTVVYGYFVAATRAFAEDRNRRSHALYRVLNEVPTLLMIFIVVLAVFKPW